MDTKVWRASGSYMKNKRKYSFTRELLAQKDTHVRERILSELGSRHRVKRGEVTFSAVKEIKPEELTDLDLRRFLGVESEQ
jgi:large subunit ribosomal protein LX